MHTPRWIELSGVVNMRDLGGLPTPTGATTAPGRLIRSDNLQNLSPDAVHTLVHDYHLTDVIDLRTLVEEALEGPGPLRDVPTIRHHHLTLYREQAPSDHGIPDAERVLPWEKDERAEAERARRTAASDPDAAHDPGAHDRFWSAHYLRYLTNRPDHVVAALRAVGRAEGAVIVHCAAGKDRTGTIVGLALGLVGVSDEAIIADYAASAERVPLILDRLRARPAYAENMRGKTVAQQSPQAETMELLLAGVRREYGGIEPYLNAHGWTDDDSRRLTTKLLGQEG